MTSETYSIEPIGILHSPFKEKFAIPRQPRLVPEAIGRLKLVGPYNNEALVRELRQFSHLWLLFMFHQNLDKGWTPTIRPPRLGGNKKVGVLASRSTFRPNGIGLSAVELLDIIHTKKEGVELVLGGVDLLDQTPIIDIKPYLPYSDIITEANGGFATERPAHTMTVSFTSSALVECQQHQQRYPGLQTLIEKLLIEDPRPAYKKGSDKAQSYGVKLYDLNVTWEVVGEHTVVTSITDR
ncbi:MAG: tRNA-Thr(GGU) m(6)t(6)A37 methyltransferase TsaA [Phenylobacterium sp.]|jgi:tRNA-Thr(GGU) m(6)t(6)A37 methyltransferase TsaA